MRAKAGGWLSAVLLMAAAVPALAGGPRFVAGGPSSTPGVPRAWRSDQPLLYFTDPGDLSKTVSHAQADGVVAAAAAIWNVPTSSLTLRQGGVLGEHVSAQNTYFDGNGVVFPADVLASNAVSKPIAVIYDFDGSITDLLLGAGASDLSSCRQHEVTESVDAFGPANSIDHAVVVINGRCVGGSTDQLNQLQYLLMRTFGRVLGLGWSQVNDNVFTAATTPTAAQMQNWPVMHPIDITCGPYTYLCMTSPFTLRPDDLNTLAQLYPVTSANVTQGKTLTMDSAVEVHGAVMFANGMGMDMVNVVVRRVIPGVGSEPWETTSGYTGVSALKNLGNPVTGPPATDVNQGSANIYMPMFYEIPRVALPNGYGVRVDVQAINPLYAGQYGLGPFQRPPLALSGTPQSAVRMVAQGTAADAEFVQTDSAMYCGTRSSGTETQPYSVDPGGWYGGIVCGPGTPAWSQVTLRAGRTWTLEAQALDEAGNQTVQKLQPVLGVWNLTDPAGTLPTVAAESVPMNAATPGMSQVTVDAGSTDATYRMVIADAWGGGRPDFLYKARVLYADNVAPVTAASAGGQITITGIGFNNGNRVTVNGVVAKVLSWSPTQIVAVAPSVTAAKATAGMPVDVAVVDLQTGGTTRITGALTYAGGGVRQVVNVSFPAALETGKTAATPFAVKVLAADGVTVVPGASVRFTVNAGGAQLAACGAAAGCVVTTNSLGVAQTQVSGTMAGAVTMTATEVSGGVSVQVTAVDADPARVASITTPTAYVAEGGTVSLPLSLQASEDGVAAGGVVVAWSGTGGATVGVSSTATGPNGAAEVGVSASGVAAGTASVQGCVWSSVCATWSLVSVEAAQWRPVVVSGAGQSVRYTTPLGTVVLRVTDAAGHGLAGATVTVAQTTTAWQAGCPAQGRCPAAAVLAAQTATAVTDADGLVSLAPLQVSGVPQTVNIAVATGTSGFVTLSLVKTP